MVTEYCLCANDLPTLITDVMGRLVDMLKVLPTASICSITVVIVPLQYFNTRTCQLVLGAGAVEAVGLKAITARHLGELRHCHLPSLTVSPYSSSAAHPPSYHAVHAGHQESLQA